MSEYIDFCYGLTEDAEIVQTLKKSVIKKIRRRYVQGTLDDYVKEKSKLSKNDMFNILPGTILIYLENGDVVGFDVSDIKDSVVAWYEIHQGEEFYTEYHPQEICDHLEYNDINYSHKDEWNHIVGHKITKVSVIKYDDGRHIRPFEDSFQMGIILETNEGDMVLSTLPDLPIPYPFILIRKSQIPQEILDNSKIIEL